MVAPLIAAAALGGLGSFFGGQAEEEAAKRSTEESKRQFDLTYAQRLKEYQDSLKSKESARGVIGGMDTRGYGQTLNYVNPYQNAIDTSINAFLSGALTPAEVAQQGKDIATGTQSINAGAATMGLPAGARAGLLSKNVSDITGNYANIASGRIGTGLGAANTAASTGANIASMNYNSGLANFLQEQDLKNKQAQLLAGYV
jgi:hypothetical protein